ncbi:hypothetical protein CR513_21729, partial [Mucuna pruriens]
MDILGPFPMAKGQVKLLLVDINYFTKWIEVEPLATITTQKVQRFVWQNIICRYGILNSMGDLGRTPLGKWPSRSRQQSHPRPSNYLASYRLTIALHNRLTFGTDAMILIEIGGTLIEEELLRPYEKHVLPTNKPQPSGIS